MDSVTRPPRATVRIAWFLRPLLKSIVKPLWRGGSKLPREGGYVVAANHLSHADPLFLAHFLYDNNIGPRFLAKDSLFNVPLVGRLLRATGQISVTRRAGEAAQSVSQAVDAVSSGKVIIVYPEGTLTRDPAAWPMTGKSGAVRIAHASRTPLIPIVQWGAQEFLWPYTKKPNFLPRVQVTIRVGEPIDLSWLGEDPSDEDFDKATDDVMDVLTDMMANIRGQSPPAERVDSRRFIKPSKAKES